MKRILFIFLLFPMLLSMSSCKLFKRPTVEKIHDVKLLKLGVDNTELEITISVNNPNSYQLKLDKLNIELLSKEREKIGAAALQKTVVIPKRKSNALTFKVTLDTRRTAKMVSLSNQSVYFYISGTGHGKALLFGKNFDFEQPYELNLKKHLQELIPRFDAGGENIFKLKRSYVKELGITKAEMAVDFVLLNPYGFTFNRKGLPAVAGLGDTQVGSGKHANQMGFTENIHSKDGSMRFQVDNFKALWSAIKGAVKGEIPYKVKGSVIIDAFGMEIRKPYEYSGRVPVSISDWLLNK